MGNRPEGWPEDMPWQAMTRERFEQMLLGVRSAAQQAVLDSGPAVEADQRATWHAAEVALAVLRPGYVPHSAALDDLRALLRWLDEDDESWTTRD